MKIGIKGLILGCLGILVLAGCQSNDQNKSSGTKEENQLLRTTALAEISTMDSAFAVDGVSLTAINTVFEGLYRLDEKGRPVPGLIENDPELNDDGTVVTYKLKKDAKWMNNDPVTAKDFVYAWQRIVNPETSSPKAETVTSLIKNGEEILNGEKPVTELGVTAIDENTLEIQLVSPQPFLKEILTNSAFFPQNENFVIEKGEKYGTSSDTILSNGAFSLENWKSTGTSWDFTKNSKYLDKNDIHLDEINVDVIKETSTALNLFRNGKLDLINLLSDATIGDEDKKDLVTTPTAKITGLLLNQKRDEKPTPLANENIRIAILSGFDKKAYTTLLNNGSVPLYGLIPPNFTQNPSTGEDFRKENGNLAQFDPNEAKKAWIKGLNELGVDELEIEILGDDLPSAKRSLEFLQDQLQGNLPGLTIKTRNIPFKNRIEAFLNQDYELMLQAFLADYSDPMNYLELFTTGNENNLSSFSNVEYDQLIDSAKGAGLNDQDKRWDDMQKAEKILLDSAGFAPIYQGYSSFLIKDTVQGVVFPTVGYEIDYRYVKMIKE